MTTLLTTPRNSTTDTGDMLAIHRVLLTALDAVPANVAGAANDSVRAEVIGSFYKDVLEMLHVHHGGEDEMVYPLL